MKFLISWHEDCLRNSRLFLERKKEQLEDLKHEVENLEFELDFRQKQISRAKMLKKDGYDEERFMKPSPIIKQNGTERLPEKGENMRTS